MEALELEDTIRNYDQCDANGWWVIDFDVTDKWLRQFMKCIVHAENW